MIAKIALVDLPDIKVIYCFTCLVNNKRYIGETVHLKRRLQDHILGLGSNRLLQNDIKKYGLHNFIFEILEVLPDSQTKNELLDRELYYKNLFPKHSLYNLKEGRETFINEPIPVIQIDLQGNFIKQWSSAQETTNVLGYDASCVSKCVKGFRHSYKNYLWIALEDYTNDLVQERLENRKTALLIKNKAGSLNAKKYCSIPVSQYTKEGNFLKDWDSANQASKELGINQAAIWQCLKGNYKQAYGFKWEYKKEIETE